ncbi:NAD-dependent glycerol-3-phosphate dehydrogenase N-terminus-domain-containing protein [Aspergillus egyptiacus]|nr:NAD-dependent glycerol-3-phosphate dehydrogenase N-terminus-domain-containing protein [Aspergillus egyptiacus]
MAGQKKHQVTVIGSGNWGSTIAKILAENTASHPDLFNEQVRMWVFEEEITVPEDSKHRAKYGDKPQKLTQVINEVHENVKYLPDIALPRNLVATPDIQAAVQDATILVFNLPHQFIGKTIEQIKGHHLPYARGISCIKGVDVSDGVVTLYSHRIMDQLGIYCGALSGANIAPEVAAERLCETTIGYDPPPMDLDRSSGKHNGDQQDNLLRVQGQRQAETKPSRIQLQPVPPEYPSVDAQLLKTLFTRPYFFVNVIKDVAGVALGGALKNIVALAAGFVAGKQWGENTKAAIIRLGVQEMIRFGRTWFPESVNERTFTEESAGIADLVASCSGGRNVRSATHAVEKGVSVAEIEETEMNGQKLQGVSTAQVVYGFLETHGKTEEFPLFCAVNQILEGKASVDDIPALLRTKK